MRPSETYSFNEAIRRSPRRALKPAQPIRPVARCAKVRLRDSTIGCRSRAARSLRCLSAGGVRLCGGAAVA
jgi:hypothetical protein